MSLPRSTLFIITLTLPPAGMENGYPTEPPRFTDMILYGSQQRCLFSVYHFAFSSWILPGSDLHAFLPATPGLPPGYWFTWFVWIGVQIFFVLSGFVIAYSCHAETTRTFITAYSRDVDLRHDLRGFIGLAGVYSL
jgi:hypothetical protein